MVTQNEEQLARAKQIAHQQDFAGNSRFNQSGFKGILRRGVNYITGSTPGTGGVSLSTLEFAGLSEEHQKQLREQLQFNIDFRRYKTELSTLNTELSNHAIRVTQFSGVNGHTLTRLAEFGKQAQNIVNQVSRKYQTDIEQRQTLMKTASDTDKQRLKTEINGLENERKEVLKAIDEQVLANKKKLAVAMLSAEAPLSQKAKALQDLLLWIPDKEKENYYKTITPKAGGPAAASEITREIDTDKINTVTTPYGDVINCDPHTNTISFNFGPKPLVEKDIPFLGPNSFMKGVIGENKPSQARAESLVHGAVSMGIMKGYIPLKLSSENPRLLELAYLEARSQGLRDDQIQIEGSGAKEWTRSKWQARGDELFEAYHNSLQPKAIEDLAEEISKRSDKAVHFNQKFHLAYESQAHLKPSEQPSVLPQQNP